MLSKEKKKVARPGLFQGSGCCGSGFCTYLDVYVYTLLRQNENPTISLMLKSDLGLHGPARFQEGFPE